MIEEYVIPNLILFHCQSIVYQIISRGNTVEGSSSSNLKQESNEKYSQFAYSCDVMIRSPELELVYKMMWIDRPDKACETLAVQQPHQLDLTSP